MSGTCDNVFGLRQVASGVSGCHYCYWQMTSTLATELRIRESGISIGIWYLALRSPMRQPHNLTCPEAILVIVYNLVRGGAGVNCSF